jgi:hypothetical protein
METYLDFLMQQSLDNYMNKWHPKLTQSQRGDKNTIRFAELELPNLLKVGGKGAFNEGKFRGHSNWKRLAKKLPLMEQQLCEWEDANPDLYIAQPWYEARELFKAQKARGEVVWPEWYEVAGKVAEAGDRLREVGRNFHFPPPPRKKKK